MLRPPRLAFAIATLTLELSEPQDQGVNSAALQVCDSVGSVVLIGAAGAIYAAAVAADAVTGWTFAEIWLLMFTLLDSGLRAIAWLSKTKASSRTGGSSLCAPCQASAFNSPRSLHRFRRSRPLACLCKRHRADDVPERRRPTLPRTIVPEMPC